MFENTVWELEGPEQEGAVIRAAIYARTSKIAPRFGYSLDEQVQRCLARCRVQQWTPVFVFRDKAISGKDPDRPAFQSLLQKAEQGLIDVVVFWKLDRFSRTLFHAVQLEKQLSEWGVALHSVTEQIDTTTSAGRFNFRNIASAAEFERDMIRERSRMGLAAMAMHGRWPNRSPPLGYDIGDDGRLVTNGPEATLVRKIFRKYIEERSMAEVARKLNREEIWTKQDKEWNARAVRGILRNRIYIGQYSVAGISQKIPECQIISEGVFREASCVRKRFKKRGATRQQMPSDRKSEHVNRVVSSYRSFVG